ncbi:FAD-binding oxidoreductase [Lactobacillus johnsonii]|uniref:FAD-binding oxidoreductase n=1 Tax=Lactobacillus johnsonii TaxID=33959 RepID=UPI003D7731CB
MKKAYPIIYVLSWIVILIILPMPLIWLLNSEMIDAPSRLIAYDAGIIAYVYWLAIVLLSTRPKWLEKYIGLPSMYFLHALVGVFALIAATYHKFNSFSLDQNVKLTGNIAWYLAIFGIIYAIFFMSGWLVDRSKTLLKVKRNLEKVFTHRVSLWIHRISIIMILLIWLHVSLITRISLLPLFPKAFDLYTVFFLGIYVVVKIRQRIGTNAELVKNVELSPKVQQLTFMLKKPEKVEAGDFFFVSLRGSGISAEFHPLSITNDPDDGRKLVFTIQRTGDWSKKVDQIPVGTLAYLEGPFGQFEKIIEKGSKTQPLILYGLGSGISPLLSIAEKYVKSRDITLLWSSAGGETILSF